LTGAAYVALYEKYKRLGALVEVTLG